MDTSPPAHILIVEDEPKMAALLGDYLRSAGHLPRWIADGREVEPAVRAGPVDLVLLDLMLPGLDGMSVCRALRGFSAVPIIMLTARVDEVDRLAGLDIGADDYICKTPFSPREVVARVKALLRRARQELPGQAAPPARVLVDEARHEARLDGRLLELTPVEFRLLAALAGAPGRVFSRATLLDRLHDDTREVTDRAVDSHIKNLRRKLQQVCPQEDPIRTIYGVGYRFEL